MSTQRTAVRYQRETHTVLHIYRTKKFTQGTARTGQDDICGAKKIYGDFNVPCLELWSHLIHSCILVPLDFVVPIIHLLYFYYLLQNSVVVALRRKLSCSYQLESPYLLRFVL